MHEGVLARMGRASGGGKGVRLNGVWKTGRFRNSLQKRRGSFRTIRSTRGPDLQLAVHSPKCIYRREQLLSPRQRFCNGSSIAAKNALILKEPLGRPVVI